MNEKKITRFKFSKNSKPNLLDNPQTNIKTITQEEYIKIKKNEDLNNKNIKIMISDDDRRNRFENDALAIFGNIKINTTSESIKEAFKKIVYETKLIEKLKTHHIAWSLDAYGRRAMRYIIIDLKNISVFIDSLRIITINEQQYDSLKTITLQSTDMLKVDDQEYILDLVYKASVQKQDPIVKYRIKNSESTKYLNETTDAEIIKKLNEKKAKRGGSYTGMPIIVFENSFEPNSQIDFKTKQLESLLEYFWNEIQNEWIKTKAWVEANENIQASIKNNFVDALKNKDQVNLGESNNILQSYLQNGATSGLPTTAYLISLIKIVEEKIKKQNKDKTDANSTGTNKMSPETIGQDLSYWNKISSLQLYYELQLTKIFRTIFKELFSTLEDKNLEIKLDYSKATNAYFKAIEKEASGGSSNVGNK